MTKLLTVKGVEVGFEKQHTYFIPNFSYLNPKGKVPSIKIT